MFVENDDVGHSPNISASSSAFSCAMIWSFSICVSTVSSSRKLPFEGTDKPIGSDGGKLPESKSPAWDRKETLRVMGVPGSGVESGELNGDCDVRSASAR